MPYQRIFLLSHMRAYTSLLGHILGSHPQINGYYEMQMGYTSAQTLRTQEQHYAQQDSFKPGSRYLFDKILHNQYELDLQLPELDDAIFLVTLRQPEQTIKSIINLFAKKNADHPYSYPAEAIRYYTERLQTLNGISRQLAKRYYYFDAESIRTDTDNTLKKLAEYLQLDTPLSTQYQQFAKTGVAGAGDTSTAIGSGKILQQPTKYSMTLKSDLLEQPTQTYQECREQLMCNAVN